MREANRGHVGDHEPEVESAEEEIEEARLSRGGRKLKTMLRQREKRMGYASDDEDANPYVSVSHLWSLSRAATELIRMRI